MKKDGERKKKKGRTLLLILGILLLLVCAAGIGISIYMITHPEEEAFERQYTEQDLADEYIEALLSGELDTYYAKIEEFKKEGADAPATPTRETEEGETIDESEALNYNFSDDIWYSRNGVTYTPEYAHGYVECVLEIPNDRVRIRRGVYSGTWDDLYFNLDIWMVVAARPDYELGSTHYCIYGHNHPVQDLSFNRLRYTKKDDYFYLYTAKGIYEYLVTRDPYPVSREATTINLVDNFDISSEYCYLITCGRDEHRYMDTIVEGKLQKIYTINEWNKRLREEQGTEETGN